MEQVVASDIAEWVKGEIDGLPGQVIDSVCKIDIPVDDSLCFLANPKYDKYLYDPAKRTVLVDRNFQVNGATGATIIRVDNVYDSFAAILKKLDHRPLNVYKIDALSSIHATAKISPSVQVGKFSVVSKNALIGGLSIIDDQVFIGENVKIGRGCRLYPGVRILSDCVIGDGVIIHANAVVGSDGFGYASTDEGYVKIRHLGNVIVHDHVEIGANTTIDRGSVGSTVIGKGSKLDNLVQVAHNVEIGENVVIAAQAGISGSTKIGKGTQLGGQVGIVGHVTIAPGSRIQAQSGIASDIRTPNKKWYGSPILSYYNYLRSFSIFKNLPGLTKRIENLEKRINKISSDTKD